MRVKTGVIRRQRHKKVLKATKGFRGANTRLYKRAHEAYLHSGQYAYIGRRLRKRDLRQLWILRISAGIKQVDPNLNYSRVMHQLKEKNIALDRKMLSELAVNDFTAFTEVINQARA